MRGQRPYGAGGCDRCDRDRGQHRICQTCWRELGASAREAGAPAEPVQLVVERLRARVRELEEEVARLRGRTDQEAEDDREGRFSRLEVD